MAILEMLLTAAGTAIATAVAVQGRQFSRPRLHVSVGDLECLMAKNDRKVPTRALAFALPDAHLHGEVFVPCVHVLHNAGKLPITDIRTELVFPRQCDTGMRAHLGRDTLAGRAELQFFGAHARETADIRILRPGEKLTYMCWLRMDTRSHPRGDDAEAERVTARYGGVSGVVNTVVLRFTVWSANAATESLTTPVFILKASSVNDAALAFQRVAYAAWDGRRPAPGVYWTPTPWRRPKYRDAAGEVIYLDRPLPVPRTVDEAKILHVNGALVTHEAPPWGYTGTSFDVVQFLRARKIRESSDGLTLV
jgi:hypothetical protein